jgi:hypothetical protein
MLIGPSPHFSRSRERRVNRATFLHDDGAPSERESFPAQMSRVLVSSLCEFLVDDDEGADGKDGARLSRAIIGGDCGRHRRRSRG